MEEDVDYVKAVVSLQRETQVRGSRSWRQTTKQVYEQQRGEKGIAAAAIALQTMQDLNGTLAHNIVLP
ncbi:unnamed protein product [Sphagnum jensenii]|jgi:hypothetical protein|uniref:Uncharacterized protein n=1 Tax=Sphagnum jensenii TaxID=128206 RepID=A0ABP0WXX2_9BRYO